MTDRLHDVEGVVVDIDGVLVGDSVDTDVLTAMAAGLRGVLVRTGGFRDRDLADGDGDPDAVIESIADLPDLLGG